MTYQFTYRWHRFNNSGTYSGKGEVLINAYSREEATEEAIPKAKREIARTMCFSPEEVEIRDLQFCREF